jgi:cation transport ATPase
VKHDLPEPTLRDRDEQTRPPLGYVGHQHEQQPNTDSHSSHEHAGHDKHAGHSPAMFQQRFLVCLLLTLPVLYLSPMFQMWFNYQAIQFAGVAWVTPILATIIYWYGGWVFLHGAWAELHSKIGMMTLVALAITVSYVYSLAVSFGLPGDSFYMELVTLVDIMLLGHWIEMTSVQGASRALEHLAKFERAKGIKTIAFDKTGTLTEGKFGVKQIYTDGIDEAQALIIAASLESLSEHPLGQSIVIEANHRHSQLANRSVLDRNARSLI